MSSLHGPDVSSLSLAFREGTYITLLKLSLNVQMKDDLKYWTYIYEKGQDSNSLRIVGGVLHGEAFLRTDYVHL